MSLLTIGAAAALLPKAVADSGRAAPIPARDDFSAGQDTHPGISLVPDYKCTKKFMYPLSGGKVARAGTPANMFIRRRQAEVAFETAVGATTTAYKKQGSGRVDRNPA